LIHALIKSLKSDP